MAEIEKEVWGQIRARSARTPLDPHDEEALQAACYDNGIHVGTGPSFMPLATEDDLAYVLHGGGWSQGTGFVYKDLAFLEQGGDEWAAFTPVDDGTYAWGQFDSMSFATASQTPEEVARTVNALAIATTDERMRGEWHQLLGALDGDQRLRWKHAVSPQEALDGTVKACRSLRAERDGVTVAVYERPSYHGWTVDVFEGPVGGKRAPGRTVNIESLSEAISLAERRVSEHVQRPVCPDWNSPFLTDELRQKLYDEDLLFKRPDGSLPPGFGVWTDAHGWLMDYVPETKGMVIEETTGMAVMSWDGAAYSDPITGEPRSFDAGAGRPGMRREDAEAVLAGALELDPTLGGKLPAPDPDGEALHRSDYMLLSRLKQDCDYYLGYGNRAEKHLWAGDADSQVAKMRELYAVLPEKPEWLTAEQIDEYERRMAPSAEDGARTAETPPRGRIDELATAIAEFEWRQGGDPPIDEVVAIFASQLGTFDGRAELVRQLSRFAPDAAAPVYQSEAAGRLLAQVRELESSAIQIEEQRLDLGRAKELEDLAKGGFGEFIERLRGDGLEDWAIVDELNWSRREAALAARLGRLGDGAILYESWDLRLDAPHEHADYYSLYSYKGSKRVTIFDADLRGDVEAGGAGDYGLYVGSEELSPDGVEPTSWEDPNLACHELAWRVKEFKAALPGHVTVLPYTEDPLMKDLDGIRALTPEEYMRLADAREISKASDREPGRAEGAGREAGAQKSFGKPERQALDPKPSPSGDRETAERASLAKRAFAIQQNRQQAR